MSDSKKQACSTSNASTVPDEDAANRPANDPPQAAVVELSRTGKGSTAWANFTKQFKTDQCSQEDVLSELYCTVVS